MADHDYTPGASDVDWPQTARSILRQGRFEESYMGFEKSIEKAEDACEGHVSEAELRAIAHEVVDEVFGAEEDSEVARRRERNEQITSFYPGP